jgi:hypothetical protein
VITKILAHPRIVDWLIRRATKTPYFHIVGADGTVYMERYWLFNPYPAASDGCSRRWGDWMPSIRLHKILREDQDRHLHDHPWDARTVILRGWYNEDRLVHHGPCPGLDWATMPVTSSIVRYGRRASDTAPLHFGEFHKITEVSPGGVWTLFITFKYRGTWGFLVDGKKVPWREYLGIEK